MTHKSLYYFALILATSILKAVLSFKRLNIKKYIQLQGISIQDDNTSN